MLAAGRKKALCNITIPRRRGSHMHDDEVTADIRWWWGGVGSCANVGADSVGTLGRSFGD